MKLNPRSVLRVRTVPHIHPDRKTDIIIEVLRDDEVVATIYGSREGVHIVSDRLQESTANMPFRLSELSFPKAGFVIPLLAEGESCPWCAGAGIVDVNGPRPCPVCRPLEPATL